MPPPPFGLGETNRPPGVPNNFCPRIAMVLGSGLGEFSKSCKVLFEISYANFPELPKPRVPGHAGKLIGADFQGTPILIAMGRVHYYEGYSPKEVTANIRLLASFNPDFLLLTNAAGIINPTYSPGEWMIISDHINFTGASPLTGSPNFVDMSQAYAPALRSAFLDAAKNRNITLHEGIYACVTGPQYETPAEIRMLRAAGSDVVGMSTAFEVIQARALNLPVAALSCLTNWAAGTQSDATLSHTDVIEVGTKATQTLHTLLQDVLPTALDTSRHFTKSDFPIPS